MNLADTPAERDFRLGVRRWLRANVPVDDPAQGRRRPWPVDELRAWSHRLHAAGLAGLTWPREHGGQGLGSGHQAIMAEESARAQAPDQVNLIGLNMVGPTLIQHGTPPQQAHHLPRILDGRALFCQGFSEAGSGSDLAAVAVRARPGPDGGLRVSGEKLWSSYAPVADHCLLLARTGDPGENRHRGLTVLLLDLRAPGVTVRPLRQLTGDAEFGQIVLDDAPVGPEAVVGAVGDGWRVAMSTLAHERGTFGIALVARLSMQLERLVRTIRQLEAGRRPEVRAEVAELAIELEALRFTGYRALAGLVRTGDPGPETTVLKLRWSLAHQRLTALATRLLAQEGALAGDDAHWHGYWQRQHLRSRANTIEGGTSEILRSIVAERVLGLPRAR